MHLHCICNPFAMHLHQKKRMHMKGKCEFMKGKVLVEYYYNGKAKTLAIYENKKHVRTVTGDEAVKMWHETIE